uniref:Uncharacterized protein n=2 Tax=Aegilops tauschii subsp. strangulata TaxID=200361 RepID=A0A453KZF2_AEGTS
SADNFRSANMVLVLESELVISDLSSLECVKFCLIHFPFLSCVCTSLNLTNIWHLKIPNTFSLQHQGTIRKYVGKMQTNNNMSDFIICQTQDHVVYFRYMNCFR